MIAKLIVWDRDRLSALRRMRQALAEYQVAGVSTNTAFLIALAGHPAFMSGDLDTGFIERFRADLIPTPQPASTMILALVALAVTLERREAVARRSAQSGDPWSPWAAVNGWRMNDQGWDELVVRDRDTDIACRIEYLPAGDLRVHGPESSLVVQGSLDGDGGLDAVIEGRRLRAGIVRQNDEVVVLLPGESHRLTIVDPRAAGDAEEGGGGQLTAPMPGKIVQVLVAEGAKVEKGQPLLILEAMKMEHTISAPARGMVAKLPFQAGDQVAEGAVLLNLETED